MRLVKRPCRKLLHSRCEDLFSCWCMCHFEATVARFYGPQFAHPVPDGERRGVTSRAISSTATDPGRPLTGDPWRWHHTVLSVPAMLRARLWRWQHARAIAREEAVRGKS